MNWRSSHRLVAACITLPLSMIFLTGLLLQLRHQLEWVQPKTVNAESVGGPLLAPEEVIRLVGPGINQIIYRPSKNNISVRMDDGMELQLNSQTGQLLKKAQRRVDFIIELHQGSWMGPIGQYGLHLLTALGLLFLILSGMLLWPFGKKRKV